MTSQLPSRRYAGIPDLKAMIVLLEQVRPATRIADFPSPTDLHELFALESVQSRTRLWFDPNDRLISFAFVDDFNNLRFERNPDHSSPKLEAEIINWAVECIKQQANKSGELPTLDASCREVDLERIAFLNRYGFVQSPERTIEMARPLQLQLPITELPTGFLIRPVHGFYEVDALADLHRTAFGTAYMTRDHRLAMMNIPDYDPLLDLVSMSPDGRMAGYCYCHISHVENEKTGRLDGYTDPVAVHPDFQRRGLAQAMLCTGLHLLQERGMQTARLSTSADNLAMQRAAFAVGYIIDSVTLWFSKAIDA